MEFMSGSLLKDYQILVRAIESFQKKHSYNKVVIGMLVKDFSNNLRPVWKGDVEALAPFTPSVSSENNDQIQLPEITVKGKCATTQELRRIVGNIVKITTNRMQPKWGVEACRPEWWPTHIPFQSVRTTQASVLEVLVLNCYQFYSQDYKLPDYLTAQVHSPVPSLQPSLPSPTPSTVSLNPPPPVLQNPSTLPQLLQNPSPVPHHPAKRRLLDVTIPDQQEYQPLSTATVNLDDAASLGLQNVLHSTAADEEFVDLMAEALQMSGIYLGAVQNNATFTIER